MPGCFNNLFKPRDDGLTLSDGRHRTVVQLDFADEHDPPLTEFSIISTSRLYLHRTTHSPYGEPDVRATLRVFLKIVTPGDQVGHLLGSPEEVGFTDDGQVLDGLATDMRDLR